VRNAEDGWRWGWNPAVTTLLVDVAKRDGNPMEGAPSVRCANAKGVGRLDMIVRKHDQFRGSGADTGWEDSEEA